MELTDLRLGKRYRSNECNIIRDFYIPCLSNSILYQRAVGYFTSSGLSFAAKGLARFIRGNGVMQLIASPYLTEADERAITLGLQAQEEILVESLLRELDSTSAETAASRLSCLAKLIASRRLEIKIAVKVDTQGRIQRGLYHEKVGIFTDDHNNCVAFTGSPNETLGGLVENFESIQVFASWSDVEGRTTIIRDDFAHLWTNSTPGLRVLPFPEAASQRLIRHLQRDLPDLDPEERDSHPDAEDMSLGMSTHHFQPWPHQCEAVELWIRNKCLGVLRMATGTGKTKTAFLALQRAGIVQRPILGVILAPYKHLMEQWKEECDKWLFKTVLCSSDYPDWPEKLGNLRLSHAAGDLSTSLVIATYSTFSTTRFRHLLDLFNQPKMLIADEVHHLGSPSNRIALDVYQMRLGVSATPERVYDEDGTNWILSQIGPIVFSFGLREAIPDYLCPYDYFLHPVYLQPAEQEEFQEVMDGIARACGRGASLAEEDPEANFQLGPLLRRRQEIIGGAAAKIPLLREILMGMRATQSPTDLNHMLFYTNERLFERLLRELSQTVGLRVSKFTFLESREERLQILDNFANARIQGMVAMKCLDEGMDIPATRTAFILASSSNPMEYVQRRGRVLRRAPGKESATIHDFFVLPSEHSPINEFDRRLVMRELDRAKEFASTSRNPVQVGRRILEIEQRYNLLHL